MRRSGGRFGSQMIVILDPRLRSWVEKRAAAEGMTLSGFIRWVLTRQMRAETGDEQCQAERA